MIWGPSFCLMCAESCYLHDKIWSCQSAPPSSWTCCFTFTGNSTSISASWFQHTTWTLGFSGLQLSIVAYMEADSTWCHAHGKFYQAPPLFSFKSSGSLGMILGVWGFTKWTVSPFINIQIQKAGKWAVLNIVQECRRYFVSNCNPVHWVVRMCRSQTTIRYSNVQAKLASSNWFKRPGMSSDVYRNYFVEEYEP